MVCYMLLDSKCMFETVDQLYYGKWFMRNLDCSIESLRFICDTVQYDRERRPTPENVKNHQYFSVNLLKVPTIKQKLPELQQKQLACLNSEPRTSQGFEQRLKFDVKNYANFGQLYKTFTSLDSPRDHKQSTSSFTTITESPNFQCSSTKLETIVNSPKPFEGTSEL